MKHSSIFFILMSATACSRTPDAVSLHADSTTAPVASMAKPDSLRAAQAATPVSADSIRGVLDLLANEPVAEIAIRSGDSVVVLQGADLEALRRIAGLDVVVRGRRTAQRIFSASPKGSAVFDVESFAIRGANGEPAVDGILDVENGVFFLHLENGARVTIARIPAPLRGEIGSRVYLVGALSGPVSAFGIVSERQ